MKTSLASIIRTELMHAVTLEPEKAKRFFKTEPGSYAEHDRFIGVSVPNIRVIAKKYADASLADLQMLLQSQWNEERLLALVMLVNRYNKGSQEIKHICYQLYMDNLGAVNNWNLVDTSAHAIIGAYTFDKDRDLLLTFAHSENMWYRRIAIVSTWYYIRQNDVTWTFKLAHILLHDNHDLIHKAVGWMLREAGKRNDQALIAFLDQHVTTMPRTMLRYAIEKLSKELQVYYLNRS